MCVCMCVAYGIPVEVKDNFPESPLSNHTVSDSDCQPWWATSLPRVLTDSTLYIHDAFFYLHLLAFLNHIILGAPILRGSEILLSIGSNLSLWIAVASLKWTQGLLDLWLTMRHQSHLVILEVVAVLIFGRGVYVWETELYQNMLVRWQRDLVILCLYPVCFQWEWTDLFP